VNRGIPKMKKSLIVAFTAIIMIVCLSSCDFIINHDPSYDRVVVTGRWLYFMDDVECMVEFGKDGTFTLVQRVRGIESTYTGKYTKNSIYDGTYNAIGDINDDLITGTYSLEGSTMLLMLPDDTYLFIREGYSATSDAIGTWYCSIKGGFDYTLDFSSSCMLKLTVDVVGNKSVYSGYFTIGSDTSGSFSLKLTNGNDELKGTYVVNGDSLTLVIVGKDTLEFSKNVFNHNYALGSWYAEEGNFSYTFVIKDEGQVALTLTTPGGDSVYTGTYTIESPSSGKFSVKSEDDKLLEGSFTVDGNLTLAIKGSNPVTMTRGGSASDAAEVKGTWTCSENGTSWTMIFSQNGDLKITIVGNGFEYVYSGSYNNGAFTTTSEKDSGTISGYYTVDGTTMEVTINGLVMNFTKSN